MKNKISKTEAKEKIEEFFRDIRNKSPKEIKKIKRLAMKFKIPLKEKRKLFCGGCFESYSGNEKVRIKNGIKTIECKNCGKVSRWKIS
jgi:RNase P subunit RPR2